MQKAGFGFLLLFHNEGQPVLLLFQFHCGVAWGEFGVHLLRQTSLELFVQPRAIHMHAEFDGMRICCVNQNIWRLPALVPLYYFIIIIIIIGLEI
jgi:hypothetical protein